MSAQTSDGRVATNRWADRPLFAAAADVTVYWPDVRPCYDAAPEHDWREQPDGWVTCSVCDLHSPDVFEERPCTDPSEPRQSADPTHSTAPPCSCGKPFAEDGGAEGVCECCPGCAGEAQEANVTARKWPDCTCVLDSDGHPLGFTDCPRHGCVLCVEDGRTPADHSLGDS